MTIDIFRLVWPNQKKQLFSGADDIRLAVIARSNHEIEISKSFTIEIPGSLACCATAQRRRPFATHGAFHFQFLGFRNKRVTCDATPGLNGTITLTTGPISFTDTSLTTVEGPGADVLSISGNNTYRVIDVTPNAAVSISGLTITEGRQNVVGGAGINSQRGNVTLTDVHVAGNTSAISPVYGHGGAGVRNHGGSMTIIRSTIQDNELTAAITFVQGGGGILNTNALGPPPVMVIQDSTIDGNTSSIDYGGIFNQGGTLTVAGTTVSNNIAQGDGGGGRNGYGGTTDIRNSTFSGNQSGVTLPSNHGGSGGAWVVTSGLVTINNSTFFNNRSIRSSSTGGGIYRSGGTLTLNSTIVAGNFASNSVPYDVRASTASGSDNLIGVSTGLSGITDGVNGNQVGTPGTPIDPMLAPLDSYGGPTQTHALLSGSPAIDADANPLSLANDQRGAGFSRVLNGIADVGAFEGLANTAPVADAGGPYSVAEGSLIQLDGSGSYDLEDDNQDLIFEWDLDYDGIGFNVHATGEMPTVSFPDNFGPRTIALRVTDTQGLTDFVTSSLEVINVAPVIDSLVLSQLEIDENDAVTLTGEFTDPGTLDTHEVLIDWGDGNSTVIALISGERAFAATHQYLDNPPGMPSGAYTITTTVTDKDTGVGSADTAVTVNNVAPVITTISSDSPLCDSVGESEVVTVSADFTDVGILDTHEAEIDWGDGTVTVGFVEQGSGFGRVTGTHTYLAGGVYTVTMTLSDDDGGIHVKTTGVAVSGIGIVDRVLYIIGTSGDDRVHVNGHGRNQIRVHADYLPDGPHRSYTADSFDRIVAYLCAGDDHMTIAGNVHIPALIRGGSGDNFIHSAGGPAILIGGTGNDVLQGGAGRNILIAGSGSNTLRAGRSGDVLVGGSTNLDDDDDALFDLLAEWNGNATLGDRIDTVINSLVVEYDGEGQNVFHASAGHDLIFADLDDLLYGNKKRYTVQLGE